MEVSVSDKVVFIKDFTFSYHEETPVLKGIDLDLEAGDRMALLGPNGAGKSTLLLALSGFLKGQGRMEIMDRPVERRALRELRQKIGFLFQDPDDQLFLPRVIDNVAFGPLNLGLDQHEARERSSAALRFVGLDGFEEKLAHHLSQGQKRLVALASVISMQPRLFLLDEPSAFLDPRGRTTLSRLIGRIDGSFIVASHDLGFVSAICTKAALLDDGRVVACGPVDDILGDTVLLQKVGLLAEEEI